MSPQEIEKLLGGYATDTLTEQERRTLFEAALGNQALFDALADEQALRELLDDPPSRAHLLATLREERVSPAGRLAAWWRRPSVLALAAAVAAGIVTIAVVIPIKTVREKAPSTVAMYSPPPQPAPAAAASSKDKAPEAKPAPPVLAGSPRKAPLERTQELERDAFLRRNSRAANTVAPAPSLPEPPAVPLAAPTPPPARPEPAAAAPGAVVSPAQSQFKAAEESRLQPQAKLADAVSPAGAGGARQEDRKKEAAPAGARALYYAAQPPAVSGFVDRPKTLSKKRELNSGLSMGRTAAASPVAVISGVRYSVLRRNPDGSFAEVDPATVFAPGDALRVRFETNTAGNLTVMERQASGAWTLRMAARTQPGEAVHMPSESTINVATPGPLRFFVRFSRSLRGEPRLDQVTTIPSLLRETAANSVYVVNPAASTDPMVDFELAINAR